MAYEGGAWGPFLCGFLLAALLSLLPMVVLVGLWVRAEVRCILRRMEKLLADEASADEMD